MKDFLGKNIDIGDIIIVAASHGRNAGASLRKAVVTGFTKCFVEYTYYNRYSSEIVKRVSRDKVVVVGKEVKLIGTGQPPANSQAVREVEETRDYIDKFQKDTVPE